MTEFVPGEGQGSCEDEVGAVGCRRYMEHLDEERLRRRSLRGRIFGCDPAQTGVGPPKPWISSRGRVPA